MRKHKRPLVSEHSSSERESSADSILDPCHHIKKLRSGGNRLSICCVFACITVIRRIKFVINDACGSLSFPISESEESWFVQRSATIAVEPWSREITKQYSDPGNGRWFC